MPSSDDNDYLEFSSNGTYPYIGIIGSHICRVTSNAAGSVGLQIYKDDNNYMELGWGKTDDEAYIYSKGVLKLWPNQDTGDYLEFSSTGTVPIIKRIGGNDIELQSDDATWMLLLWRDDVSNWMNFGFNKADHYTQLRSTGEFRLITNNDTDNYLEFSTVDNVPIIDAPTSNLVISGNSLIYIKAGNDIDDYFYFATTSNIASLFPSEDKAHNLGGPSDSFDHVYSDDFDNTSPFEEFVDPLSDLKNIKSNLDKTKIDYTSLPDFIRTHTRDAERHVWGKRMVINDKTQEEEEQDYIIERAPKDVIEDEGWSVNRMAVFLYQACQKLQEQNEQLDLRIKQLEIVK
jgi:hypothetical protein